MSTHRIICVIIILPGPEGSGPQRPQHRPWRAAGSLTIIIIMFIILSIIITIISSVYQSLVSLFATVTIILIITIIIKIKHTVIIHCYNIMVNIPVVECIIIHICIDHVELNYNTLLELFILSLLSRGAGKGRREGTPIATPSSRGRPGAESISISIYLSLSLYI